MFDPRLLIDDVVTPLPLTGGLVQAVVLGHEAYLGDLPSPATAAIEVACVALETGNGLHMHRYNAGNVKWSADWAGLLCMFACNEVIGGEVQWFRPPNPQTWFRAFLSAQEGMAAQVAFWAGKERYAKAWHQFMLGRPDAAVRALADAGYFTANVDAYARAVSSIFQHVLPLCAAELALPGVQSPADAELEQRVGALVYGAGYDLAFRDLRLGEDLAA